MARERRSTLAIVGRFMAVVATVTLIHLGARVIYLSELFRDKEYIEIVDEYGFTHQELVPVSIWHMPFDTIVGGWLGVIALHLLSIGLLLVLVLVIGLIMNLLSWIFVKPEPRPYCQDKNCKCVEHHGQHFRNDGNYWSDTSESEDAATTALVVGVAVGTAIGASS